MTHTNHSSQNSVLVAYAAAGHRAEQALQAVRDRCQPQLEAARLALQQAKDGELVRLNETMERAVTKACQLRDQGERKASTDHGLAMTDALNMLERARSRAEQDRDEFLHDPRVHYQFVVHALYSALEPGCQPAYDALMVAEAEAGERRAAAFEAARIVYLEEKGRLDVVLSDRLSDLLDVKNAAVQAARSEHEGASKALIAPLQEALENAEAVFEKAMGAAHAQDAANRRTRLEILGMHERKEITAHEAIDEFEMLGT
jgi:hypothetical protein